MITADAGLRGGKVIPLKRLVDEAISVARFQPEHVLVCDRHIETPVYTSAGRDLDYAGLREEHLRDEVPVHCFVVLKKREDSNSIEAEATLKQEIESTVVQNLGAFARPAAIYVVRVLPKTRSGKILRRAIHAAIEGRDTGDLSTLEDPIAIEAIKELLEVTKKSR